MNDVQIEQACEILHVDLFNSISQKSNNENVMSPIFEKYLITILTKVGRYIIVRYANMNQNVKDFIHMLLRYYFINIVKLMQETFTLAS